MNRAQSRNNMKRMRRAKRITQAQLAELSGMSQWKIAENEQCKRDITKETLELFSRLLDWPIEELLWRAE
ncbi:MAG: helix-turn-helix transcriptional regulator [Clostridia bacterium]|nr:helix-turn-helix transcriptional regulator [Clostridia bacterium]